MDLLQWAHIRHEKQHMVRVGAFSDIGCFRHDNEDNYLVGGVIKPVADAYGHTAFRFPAQEQHYHLLGVFDGMGGGEQGEIAARITAEAFRCVELHLANKTSTEEIDQAVHAGLEEANRKILALREACNIYGTTATLFCTDGVRGKLYHLGDSRAYLLRQGQLCQLTQDQTLAQMKIDLGLCSEEDPALLEDSHLLTDYVGKEGPDLRFVESAWFDLQSKDRILLCSDGLYAVCTHSQITSVLTHAHSAEAAAKKLIHTALANGGQDNTTCIVLMED